MEAATATRRSTTAGSTGTTISQEDNTSPLAHVATGAVLIRQPASLSTHPLVSALSAAYVLGVLYLPRRILSLLLSPALVSALLLLATLLYFGSPSRLDHRQSRSPELRQHFHSEDQRRRRRQERHQPRAFPQPAATPDTDHNSPAAVLCSVQKPLLLAEHHHFVEWPRWGPLEVIYEEYEGGEEEEDVGHSPAWPASGRSPGMEKLERIALRCYSDDSDDDDSASYSVGGSSPAWDLPEDLFFRLDLEEEGLIEIPLEEDNLIEIDISACR